MVGGLSVAQRETNCPWVGAVRRPIPNQGEWVVGPPCPHEKTVRCEQRIAVDNHKMLPAFQLKLWSASESGDEAEVRRCLELGADVNTKNRLGWNAMHRACMSGSTACVELLLPKDESSRADLLARPDGAGNMPLHIAAASGHAEVVNVLLGSGAAVDAIKAKADGGESEFDTPMHSACKLCKDASPEMQEKLLDVIMALLARGGLLEAKDRRGREAAAYLTKELQLRLLTRVKASM